MTVAENLKNMSMQPGKYNTDNQSFIPEDPELDIMIKAHKRALIDLEEIISDPFLEETKALVSSTGAEISKSNLLSERNKKFVQNSLSQKSENQDELKNIRIEIKESDIKSLSVEWVNEWHRKKQEQAKVSQEDNERKNFISDSLNEAPVAVEEKSSRIIPYRRFASMAAAAVIGIIILIAALTPSSDPGQLFKKYYESFPAMTSVTRTVPAADEATYNQAIDYYKAGRYSEAAVAFRQAAKVNSASFFYLGLSELENSNIDQAISALEIAAENQAKFYKETRWYLGLAYLKKGNKSEAAKYFDTLAGTEGFYSKRAAKILRRLK